MKIKIEDYISEEEKKEIVVAEYRGLVRRHMTEENDLKRIMSNVAYDVFYKIVDEGFDESSMELIKKSVDSIIANPTAYNIFKAPDAWDGASNEAYKILQKTITENTPRIKKMVSDLLEEQTVRACKEDVKDLVNGLIEQYVRRF